MRSVAARQIAGTSLATRAGDDSPSTGIDLGRDLQAALPKLLESSVFLYVEQKIDFADEVVVGIGCRGVVARGDSLEGMLYAECECALQRVVYLIGYTLAPYPYIECRRLAGGVDPLLGDVVAECEARGALVGPTAREQQRIALVERGGQVGRGGEVVGRDVPAVLREPRGKHQCRPRIGADEYATDFVDWCVADHDRRAGCTRGTYAVVGDDFARVQRRHECGGQQRDVGFALTKCLRAIVVRGEQQEIGAQTICVPDAIDEWHRIELRYDRYFRVNDHRPYCYRFGLTSCASLARSPGSAVCAGTPAPRPAVLHRRNDSRGLPVGVATGRFAMQR